MICIDLTMVQIQNSRSAEIGPSKPCLACGEELYSRRILATLQTSSSHLCFGKSAVHAGLRLQPHTMKLTSVTTPNYSIFAILAYFVLAYVPHAYSVFFVGSNASSSLFIKPVLRQLELLASS